MKNDNFNYPLAQEKELRENSLFEALGSCWGGSDVSPYQLSSSGNYRANRPDIEAMYQGFTDCLYENLR